MDDIKSKIRPIYSELQGVLPQAPKGDGWMYKDQQALWDRFNYLLKKLHEITQDPEYLNLEIKPRPSEDELIVTATEYRGKVSGLISRLHGTFFYKEQEPFSGVPTNVNIQSQAQEQTQYIAMLLEIQDKISTKLASVEEGSPEKGFLENVKAKLPGVKGTLEFVNLLMTTAKEFGIDVNKLGEIFK